MSVQVSRRDRRLRVGCAVIGAAVLAGATGCTGLLPTTGPAPQSPGSSPVTSVPSDPAGVPSTGPTTGSTPGSNSPAAQPAPSTPRDGLGDLGPVVATRSAGVETTDTDSMKTYGDPASLQVYPLRRTGRVLQLNFAITLDRRAHDSWIMVNTLGKPDSLDNSVGGVQLIDVTHAKVYYAGRDRDRDCICSGDAELGPGQTVVFTAAFAAPPLDVTSMTVTVPLFGSFGHVPIV